MSPEELDRARAAIQTKFAGFKNYIDKYEGNPDSLGLKIRYNKITAELNSYESIQSEIEMVCADITGELKKRAEFEEECLNYITKAERLLLDAAPTVYQSKNDDVTPENTQNNSQINFPKLELPKFDGTLEAWPGFVDAFRAAVHNDKRITNAQRLIYLRSCLTGKASSKIESLSTTEANYEVAWNLLVKAYDNPNELLFKHIKAFFDLPRCDRTSGKLIGEILDSARKHLRALEALTTPFYEAFSIYAITSKLDDETYKKWKEVNVKMEAPSLEALLEFLHERHRILGEDNENKSAKCSEAVQSTNNSDKRKNQFNKNTYHKNQRPSSMTLSTQIKAYCYICKGTHFTQSCEEMTKLSVEDRIKLTEKSKLCFNCLRGNHQVKDCRSNGCRTCGEKHHTILHKIKPAETQLTNFGRMGGRVSTRVLLSTALINFVGKNGEIFEARVLLDSGSQTNFISQKLAKLLGIPAREVLVPVSGINNTVTNYSREIDVLITSRVSKFRMSLSFLIRKNFGELLHGQQVNTSDLDLPSNLKLADPQFSRPGEVDALLGAKIFYRLLCPKQKTLNRSNAILQKTHFGWVVAGEVTVEPLTCNFSAENVNETLLRFWELEEVPRKTLISLDERECESYYELSTTRDINTGRYTVRLPFRENKSQLGESYDIALKRFLTLERTLDHDTELKNQYKKFLKEYETLNHMNPREHVSNLTYLPHHGVKKQTSQTTKLRVVFDASSRTSSGLSLNDVLRVGPIIQEDLLSIILRLRKHSVVLTADIEKMYRQVAVHEEDRIYQNILWREHKDQKIQTFQLNTITYGTAPASFLATRTLRQLSNDESSLFPNAARVVREDFYMDDLITGASSLIEAKALRNELIELTNRGCFSLRQWASNREELIKDLDNNSVEALINLNMDDLVKTLGVYWKAKNDSLNYRINKTNLNESVSKRTILGSIAKLFDPLGLLGPVLIRAKIILQKLWQCGLDWDSALPNSIRMEWINYRNDLEMLDSIKFDRQVVIQDYNYVELHGFSDASEKAYGACIYIKSLNRLNKPLVRLLCAKSRVAPLKTVTLPRLELCGAVLLSRLYQVANNALRISFDRVIFWSDSMIVLNWLKSSPHTLKTFVANRVAEIQETSLSASWRYVPSADNSSDLLTRGLTISELKSNSIWFNGPSWLKKGEESWPRVELKMIDLPELKGIASLVSTSDYNDLLLRVSSFRRLQRLLAWALRFTNNCLRIRVIKKSQLEIDEINLATNLIIKSVQRESFSEEIKLVKTGQLLKGPLLPLTPFIDELNILRVGGRLANADITYAKKHPALLPRHHHVTDMIIRETHTRMYHAGAQATLNAIREKFWLINGKQYVRNILYKCVVCRHNKPIIPEYLMGNLPKSSVNYTRPFLHVGVDFAGPLFIKERRFRNRGKVKIYIAVFVCFSTKAVHLELVEDLSSEAFIASLKRFFARRGKATNLYSDNATNFVGSKRYLNYVHEFFADSQTQGKISDQLATEGVKWHHIPPRAPHFGGLWEAAVKSVKRHLIHVAKDRILAYETLLTYVVEIEAILNSRPLIPLSSDPNDLSALTPGHFLIGAPLTSLPEPDIKNIKSSKLNQWELAQQMRIHFWQRWNKEYLHTLIVRSKWQLDHRNIKEGDLVILKEDNTPPMN